MAHVIINEKLYDKEFVEKWTYGFDELKERVQEFTPERVSSITWAPKEAIVKAARLYAKSKPAAIHWGLPVDRLPRGRRCPRPLPISGVLRETLMFREEM